MEMVVLQAAESKLDFLAVVALFLNKMCVLKFVATERIMECTNVMMGMLPRMMAALLCVMSKMDSLVRLEMLLSLRFVKKFVEMEKI